MRILHTSDWHLGISAGPASRGPDHDLVLDWLVRTLDEEQIDTLVIAGDVFDAMQPSTEALQRYYAFLARVSTTGVAQVVVVGGNHDSASRLEAPSAVLQALKVFVVGGITSAESSQESCVVPLYSRSGTLEAVALAVPYVHEFRLGVRTTDLDTSATRAAFMERFKALYTRLTEVAMAQFPGVPVVALGHMTVGKEPRREDYPHEIHQVGAIDALPASVFDPRIQYVALGHIHRSYPADEARRVWYCGTPLATSLPEGKSPRKVLRVDLSNEPAGMPTVTPLVVPGPRALLELEAPPDELLHRVRRLSWEEPLPPLLYIRVRTDALPSDFSDLLNEAIGSHPEGARPVWVELRHLRETPIELVEEVDPRTLEELTPSEVFSALLQAAGRPNDVGLTAAFSELMNASEEDMSIRLRAIEGGEA